jgi:N6-L-threonylcarbamoyladenine synthase
VRILAIESSCDETAAAVGEDGRAVLSSVVASQMVTHGRYGGVVPELASREHLRAIVPVVREALALSGTRLADLAAIAATVGPGLVGSLLVGLTYAKSLSFASGVPLIAVNHIEGHIHAVLMEALRAATPVEYPALALVVSGGHTHLFEVCEGEVRAGEVREGEGRAGELREDGVREDEVRAGELREGELREGQVCAGEVRAGGVREGEVRAGFQYRLLGKTRDDAAGEAFDKVAKLLGFGYPGGPIIDSLAPHGNPSAVRFTFARMKGNALDFSFSGMKTAVLRWVEAHDMAAETAVRRALLRECPEPTAAQWLAVTPPRTLDLLASFQHAVIHELLTRAAASAQAMDARALIVSGGVACNSGLREAARRAALPYPVYFPTPGLSTDNAAMIAAAAFPKLARGEFASLDIAAQANLTLA